MKKNKCKKMLMEIYGLNENFFKEIDQSIKHNCRNANDIRTYFIMFQGFSQELMMLVGNLMKWKFRVPGFIEKDTLYVYSENHQRHCEQEHLETG
ncbi:hypothetical protein EVA_11017 [gut metagenome]|uniref:Uncharacterized protein n=1 Tax=gut metagenome TaxID=749906 RepID=J9G1Z2_9ZZZZ